MPGAQWDTVAKLMKKKPNPSRKVDTHEAQRRVAMHAAAHELDQVKREMLANREGAVDDGGPLPGAMDGPVESIVAAGKSGEEIWKDTSKQFNDFLDELGNFAFSWDLKGQYFKDNKITWLVGLLKGAGYTLEANAVLDIHKNRVKQSNGGKMPTVTEKAGLFAKSVTRPMKVGEIAHKFEVTVDLPPDELRALTGYPGTQRGILEYVRSALIDSEDIRDPIKKAQRKHLAMFLKGAGLLDLQTKDNREKMVVACLLTPQDYQPKSQNDTDRLLRFRGLLSKGVQFLKQRNEELAKKGEANSQGEE